MGEVCGIGLIGCGVVGQGVVRILQDEAGEIERKTGATLKLIKVADKDVSQPKKVNVAEANITTDANALFADDSIRVIIELVGGTGIAKEFVLKALKAGKHVVTANKALLAKHGKELYQAAAENGVCIAFEASCGGGIPLILPLRTGLIANRINAIYGILNGTCNYILSEMDQKGKSYAVALKEAQEAGYAELDPTLDVNGGDTAHKLAILGSIAFTCDVAFDKLHIEGIEQLDAQDLAAGRELGYVCKLLGIADRTDAGLSLRVHPAFIHDDHPLASTSGSFNAISVYGNWVGHTMYYGRGAGQKPTASAVVADVVEIAVGNAGRTFDQLQMLNHKTQPPAYVSMDELEGRFYLRLSVEDKPGVMGQLAKVFGDQRISLKAVNQHEPPEDQSEGEVPIVILTGLAREKQMRTALAQIETLPAVRAKPVMIRVVEEHEEYPA